MNFQVFAALLFVSAVSANLPAQTTTATLSKAAKSSTRATTSSRAISSDDDRVLTREQRIEQHHARIQQILDENRARQMQQPH